MRNEELETKRKRVQELEVIMDETKIAYGKYLEATFERGRLAEQIREEERRRELSNIQWRTKYREPEYPSVGYSSRNGYCHLQDKEQAEKLLNCLRSNTGYHHAYILEWTEPGHYNVVPDYKHDHDNDLIYTATIERMEDQNYEEPAED